MVSTHIGVFRFVLLTPKAKLLDCRVGSIILPTHDGQWGVLRNHCPLLAKLSLGILQVRDIADRQDAFYIVEGGFARVTENHVTVLAYDVITFEEKDKESIQNLISDARTIVVGQEYIRTQQGQVDMQRARLIVRMADLAKIEQIESTQT